MHFTNAIKAQTNALNGCLATKFERVEPNSVLYVATIDYLMLEKDDAHVKKLIGNTEMKTFGHGLGLVTTSQSQGQGHKAQG